MTGILARLCWCIPFVLCFFPEQLREDASRSPGVRPLHVMIDDSKSMQQRIAGSGTPRRIDIADRLLGDVATYCRESGCEVKPSRLGELDKETPPGATPDVSRIGAALRAWWMGTASDPWLLISDGGDALAGGAGIGFSAGRGSEGTKESPVAGISTLSSSSSGGPGGPGMLVGFQSADPRNLYFESVAAPPYAFEGRPMSIDIQLGRGDGVASSQSLPKETVQVQVRSGSQVLSVAEVAFASSEPRAGTKVMIPSLARGEQPLEIIVLPSPAENMLWDNSTSLDVEVLPNTLGLLHLLGAPGWDGRFLRRLVKSEPKFDQISFFILRDPWDNLQVPDRELSLIPFPAERLFNEELKSFRVLVLQDFTLGQFLQPEYQSNLVQFVKNGGGLLFIGGPRALLRIDLSSSPLREILPFTSGVEVLAGSAPAPAAEADGDAPGGFEGVGAGYDPDTPFRIEFATPDPDKRDLVSVYDDWMNGGARAITLATGLRGLHVIPRQLIDTARTTPLLNARLPGGQVSPLAMATFPGRGRALWLLSDSMWRLAMSEKDGVPRETYDRFLMASLHWLLRQDLRKPVVASRLSIWAGSAGDEWSVNTSGPAIRHFDLSSIGSSGAADGRWQIKMCGVLQKPETISLERIAPDQIILSGKINRGREPRNVATDGSGSRRRVAVDRPYCKFEVEGEDKSFGSVKASTSAFVQKPLTDREAIDSVAWMRRLEDYSSAKSVFIGKGEPWLSPEAASSEIGRWIRQKIAPVQQEGKLDVAIVAREQPVREDPYWPFKRWWAWALMSMMPVEVIVRRWWKVQTGKIPVKSIDQG